MHTIRPIPTVVVDESAPVAFPHTIEIIRLEPLLAAHYCRATLDDGSTMRSRVFLTIEEARAFAAKTLIEGLYLPEGN